MIFGWDYNGRHIFLFIIDTGATAPCNIISISRSTNQVFNRKYCMFLATSHHLSKLSTYLFITVAVTVSSDGNTASALLIFTITKEYFYNACVEIPDQLYPSMLHHLLISIIMLPIYKAKLVCGDHSGKRYISRTHSQQKGKQKSTRLTTYNWI